MLTDLHYDFDHMIDELTQSLNPRATTVQSYGRGDHVFRQGGVTSGMFLMLTGGLQLQRMTEAGDPIIVHRPQVGDSFAEASIFSDHYHCDAICTEPSSIMRLRKVAVLEKLRSDPGFAEMFSKIMAKQVQGYRQVLEIVAIRSAKDRVAAGLSVGLHNGTIMDFASRIGLTHEATYRALRVLVIEGRVANPERGIYHLR